MKKIIILLLTFLSFITVSYAINATDTNYIDFYQKEQSIYLKYTFNQPINSQHLQFFAGYAKDVFFEIPVESWELIKYVAENK